ncbi:serine hydrolase domain-containing protein [Neolewinella antarctica]|uniref:CubicO group peptidase (Beta-lactamase class C family) n=1 Tax=Neolewinella antarctica TaxID=442734 RepID=A0ABX0X8Z8_9BACT|nr:serine hydrolase [Neolewinella antarctica]NJC25262.1 CubicO group peptidase (beta-lactamase class C family) [Neolewinella antarctica]
MKTFLFTLLTALFLLQPARANAAGWVDEVIGWFSELFAEPSRAAVVATAPTVNIDSLRSTPLGILLNRIPSSDTLAVRYNWPFASADARGEVARYERLLRQTILLTDPTNKLPLSADAVRVIYQPGHRPGYFLDLLARFTDVQEVVFSDLVADVLKVSPALPTVILVDDAQFTGTLPWYLELGGAADQQTTVVHFGPVDRLAGVPGDWSVINCPLRSKESEAFLAQALVGAELIDARLSTTTPAFAAGAGFRLTGDRTGFRLPEQLGVDREELEKIDYQINRGIRYRAMPGAQLLVMKGGQVVYEKAYGHQVYRKQAVNNADLYDLASVTKAASTSLAVMKLYDRGELALKKRVRDYLPEFKRNLVGRYRIDQLLSHHTGLQPNLPIGPLISRQFTADESSPEYPYPLGPGKWLGREIPGAVKNALTGQLEYTKKPMHQYSDLNYYLLQLIVERVSGESLDEFVRANFYAPMGLRRLTYKPNATFPAHRIVPTIDEPWMRGGLLRGDVHDEGAALLGGVGGHAGLFGNAHDLGQLFQLLNNRGSYHGKEYLRPETVALFTGHGPYNYRALAFDRLAGRWGGAHEYGVSTNTIGHLGYTGTSVWADPDNDLVYVLLTNRVNPDPTNAKFREMAIRSHVSRVVYRALDTWEVNS